MRESNRTFSLTAAAAIVATLLAGACVARDRPTLYDKLGRDEGITRIVDDFVVLILDDDRINFAFGGGNMDIFKQRLSQQFCALANGPCVYTGRDMHTAHEKLKVTPAQFNALAEDLYVAMKRSHIPYRTQNQFMALLAPMEREMVEPGVHLDRTPSDADLPPPRKDLDGPPPPNLGVPINPPPPAQRPQR